MISLIVAMTENRVIGKGNDIPWRILGEQKRFKELTTGHSIIMGRKTFESLGSKPLPNRRNIIVTRSDDFTADGCEIAERRRVDGSRPYPYFTYERKRR